MILKLAMVTLAALAAVAHADPIAVSISALNSFGSLGSTSLQWRGGLVISSSEKTFGGLSGLALSDDCTGLLAVSDRGSWFQASLNYERGNLTGIFNAELAPMLDSAGKPPRNKSRGDAEALTHLGGGRYMVGFETRTRIGIYDIGKDGLKARFQLIKSPKAIVNGPSNGEVESLGQFRSGPLQGHYLAISEYNLDRDGNIRGWLWRSAESVSFSIKRLEDYRVTDAAILPDGDIIILERSFGTSLLPGMAIRRISASTIKKGVTVEPQLLFSGRALFYAIDNMEGVALCSRAGETRLTIVSDNNFSPRQRTLLLQFAYEP